MRIQKTVSISLLLFTLLSAMLAGCGAFGNPASANPTEAPNGSVTPAPQPVDVVITLQDNKILPSRTSFSPGATYVFYVANTGKKHHGLVVVPSALNVSQMTATQFQQTALFTVNDLAPGKSSSVEYTFPATSAGASYQMTSPLPGDYKAGLILAITVKASS
jgi:uncharacterized cupredoxin-like copper-binding protein